MNIVDFIIPTTIFLVTGITTLVIVGIWRFGKFLFKQRLFRSKDEDELDKLLIDLIVNKTKKPCYLLNSWQQDHTEKRNDFWTTYGQIVICVFIVCIIAILLLTKVISAEAGLPILSVISGFAIAKGSTMRSSNNENDLSSNEL